MHCTNTTNSKISYKSKKGKYVSSIYLVIDCGREHHEDLISNWVMLSSRLRAWKWASTCGSKAKVDAFGGTTSHKHSTQNSAEALGDHNMSVLKTFFFFILRDRELSQPTFLVCKQTLLCLLAK